MNSILKQLVIVITTGIIASFNLNAMAEEAASGIPALQSKEELMHEGAEAASGAPTLQDEVERLKQLKPKQLAEEQKALHEAMQKMTPEQRVEQREEMQEELARMSELERKTLHDKRQTATEKLLSQEHAEHNGDTQHKVDAIIAKKPIAQHKTPPLKTRPTLKHKARKHTDTPLPATPKTDKSTPVQ